MSKRSALGRGLGALIPAGGDRSIEDVPSAGDSLSERFVASDASRAGIRQVPVDAILPNPHQPRQRIDAESLAELAASIAEHGLIQPLVVSTTAPDDATASEDRLDRYPVHSDPHDRTAETQYTLIAGERRLQAARQAGLTSVPVIVKEATPEEMLELALVENIQRADLNPLEEAAAYHQLSETFGLTQQEIADKVGKNRVSVANALRLLRLPDFCQSMLANEQISEGHARAMLALEHDKEMMQRALKTVVKRHLSVRQTEELVRRLRTLPASPKATRTTPPETRALETEFAQALGTKVNLSRSKRGGRLTIHFYSEEELQGLYELLVERRRDVHEPPARGHS
jgi:ParB family chromosome partitioning protein